MEMHVQALAIDSARDNVDLHFSYICRYQAGGGIVSKHSTDVGSTT
jgi:hypothetical protein